MKEHTLRCLPVVNVMRCTACGRCIDACGLGLRKLSGRVSVLSDPDRCPGEALCSVVCPRQAIEMIWIEWPPARDP